MWCTRVRCPRAIGWSDQVGQRVGRPCPSPHVRGGFPGRAQHEGAVHTATRVLGSSQSRQVRHAFGPGWCMLVNSDPDYSPLPRFQRGACSAHCPPFTGGVVLTAGVDSRSVPSSHADLNALVSGQPGMSDEWALVPLCFGCSMLSCPSSTSSYYLCTGW